jgi:ABC-2 type transport system permease protein
VGLFFLLYPQAIWVPSLWRVLLFVPVLGLAFALRFLMQYTFAMFAFWTERASAIEQFWFLFYLFLSGLIAPLEVFPPLVREVALWTPFPYLIHFPAALLIGLPVDIVRGLLMMLGWSLLCFVVNRWLWRKGLKQYSGMGA